MKKILSLALVAVMLITSLVITVSAKDPYGTIVELPYTATAPSMEDALPDASWGEKLIHVDKNTKNAGITQYKPKGTVKQDLSFDLYGMWNEQALYLCFTSPDPDFRGGLNFWWGDGIQMVIYPGIADISYCNAADTGWSNKEDFENWDWCITFDVDDETPQPNPNNECYDHSTIYGDTKTSTLVVKFEIPMTALGYKKTEIFKEGDLFSFSMLRSDGSDEDLGEAYVGWLEWGDFFNAKKGWNPEDISLYVPTSENAKTTSANTFKLVGKGAGEATQTEQPEQPAASEQPSSWAKDEVNAAIAAGLVPADLQKNYTKGISRGDLAKMLSALIEKAYGKAPEKTDSKFTDSTDADVLNAANLGIITGYEDGTFKPEKILKRSEMSVIINRVAKLCGKTVTGFDSEVKFTDTATHWCKGELGWPVHAGIVKGTSATEFSPENTLTVEQTIMMIYRTFEALK